MTMKKTLVGFLFVVGVIVSIAARADVDWKWDTSGHVETAPATASVAISTMLPDTAKQTTDEGCLNLFSFLWLDSNPFELSGAPLGLFLMVR